MMVMKDYSDLDRYLPTLRREYRSASLDERDLLENPLEQFARWFEDALKKGCAQPNAMILATVSEASAPSARTVLLKGFDENGFVFYSDYGSRKGREIAENPRASCAFYWTELERQVIVTGAIQKTSREESLHYFRKRPREAQIAASVSTQSAVIKDRAVLEARFEEFRQKWEGREIPLPENWGGYRLSPETIEFWQGRENRLNDRLRYVRDAHSHWRLERLQP